MKHIERLRKVVNMAIKYEWLEKDPFINFKPTFIRTSREFLTIAELTAIEGKKLSISRLNQIWDLFVFSCYTGLSYIDVYNLTPQNISLGIDNNHWLSTSRKKTEQPVKIPLLPKAWEIIEKYKAHPKVLSTGKLLPVYSNQRLNSYMKEIADLCGIKKNLTFHICQAHLCHNHNPYQWGPDGNRFKAFGTFEYQDNPDLCQSDRTKVGRGL